MISANAHGTIAKTTRYYQLAYMIFLLSQLSNCTARNAKIFTCLNLHDMLQSMVHTLVPVSLECCFKLIRTRWRDQGRNIYSRFLDSNYMIGRSWQEYRKNITRRRRRSSSDLKKKVYEYPWCARRTLMSLRHGVDNGF